MTIRPLGSVLRSIQTLFDAGSTGGMTEDQLLERFLSRRSEDAEAAFAALLGLHGPMVWKVCRGILPDPHAAEDAFQATFLILVRKAGSIRRRDTIGPWLYGVARRVAVRAKAAEYRRRLREERGMEIQAPPAPAPIPRGQLEALHEELDRLPEKYRDPVVLCHLEGRTHAEAARLLDCPVGTVSIRLSRARDRLRVRLTRRGWSLPATLAGATLVPEGAAAAIPGGLAESTVGAARCLAAGKVAAVGVIPTSVAQLTEGVIGTMIFAQLRTAAAGILAASLVTAGVGLLANREGTAQVGSGVPRVAEAPLPAPAKGDDREVRTRSKDNLKRIGLALQNFAITNDGRLPPAAIRKDGKPLLSWRVALLPFLDSSYEALYRKFRLDESWDSPHNKALLEELPAAYAPVARKNGAGDATYYQVLVGTGALFDGDEGTKLSDIKDSPSLTLMVVEADRPVPWTKPDDVPYDRGQPPRLGGQFEGGAHVVFADGGALFLGREIAPATLHALISHSGGEVIGADDLHPDRKKTLHQLMEEINGRSLAVRKTIRTPVAYKKAQSQKELVPAAEALIALSKEVRGMSEDGAKDVRDVADPGRRWIELSDALTRQLEDFAEVAGRPDTIQAAARSAWNLVNQKCASCHTVFRVEDGN